MGTWDFLKKMALGMFATLITAIFFALMATVAIGWDFRLSLGIFAAIFAAIPLFLIKDYFPKWTGIVAAVLLLGMALIAVWPGVEYALFVNGERTMVAYEEWKIARDLQVAEALNPEGLQLRALVLHYKKKREDMLRQDLTNELKQVWDLRASGQMTEVQLQKREREIIEWYGRAIATVWSTNLDSQAIPSEVSQSNGSALSPAKLWWNELPWLAKIGLIVAFALVIIGLLRKFAPVSAKVAPVNTVAAVAQSQLPKIALWIVAGVALYYFVWPQVKPAIAHMYDVVTGIEAPIPAQRNPDGSYVIPANIPGVDTEAVYRMNSVIEWRATGSASARNKTNDFEYVFRSPDGWVDAPLPMFNPPRIYMAESCAPMQLIGRVGKSPWFCMGSSGKRIADDDGGLVVARNDMIGFKTGHLTDSRIFYKDNLGSDTLWLINE